MSPPLLTVTLRRSFVDNPAFEKLLAFDEAKLVSIVGERMALIQPIALEALHGSIQALGLIGETHELYDLAYVTPYVDSTTFPLFYEFGDTAPYSAFVIEWSQGRPARDFLSPALQEFLPVLLLNLREAIKNYLKG